MASMETLPTESINRTLDPFIDLNSLSVQDLDPLPPRSGNTNYEDTIRIRAQENLQLLLNKLFELPKKKVDDATVVKLPPALYGMPREKPIPKPKPATKWQQYAKLKGIQNKKKQRMVWDETSRSYKPAWGYKRANDEMKDWVIPIPNQVDPYQDFYGKRLEAKKERVAKNDLHRLRNVARESGEKVTGVGYTDKTNDVAQLTERLHRTKEATASVGKFTDKLKGEKAPKNLGKRHQFDSNEKDVTKDKGKMMDVWQKIETKIPRLDVRKAVLKHEAAEVKANRDSDEKPKKKKAGQNKKEKGSKRKQAAKSMNKKKFSQKNRVGRK